jgi:hypothetical protein
MANTKEMTREERKANKRVTRKELKELYRSLKAKELDEFRGKIRGGVKGFKLGTNEEND